MKISPLSALLMLLLAAVAEAGRTTVSASRTVATQVNEKARFHDDRRRKLSESEDEEESESESESESEDSADQEEDNEVEMAYGAAGSAVVILSALGALELRRQLAAKKQQEEEGSTLSYHLNHDNQGVEVV